MVYVESNFDKTAVSKKGACGLMQIMPATAAAMGVERAELFDEDINIQVGLHYMQKMLKMFGKTNLALAAYNSGPRRVKHAGNRIPRIKETINYVKKVNKAMEYYGQL